MFVRTQRLTLRPGWPEDAAELANAIGHESVIRNLSRAPWPYGVRDAEDFLAIPREPTEPKFLAFEHVGDKVRLIGGIGIGAAGAEPHELGYWLTPQAWGRGCATEAGLAVLQAAKARGIRRVTACHFVDNPASGRVLRKLGFRPTGRVEMLHSLGRGTSVPTVRHAIDLSEDAVVPDPDARMAA